MKKIRYGLGGILLAIWMVCVADVHAFTPVQATVNQKGIVIRSEAGVDSEVLSSASAGSTLTVSDAVTGKDGRTWYVVFINGNTKGYIRGDLLTLDDKKSDAKAKSSAENGALGATVTSNPETAAETEVKQSGSGKVSGDGVRIRSLSSTSSSVVAVAAKGTKVKLLLKATGTDAKIWYQVSCKLNGKEVVGYIRSDLVKIGKDVETVSTKNVAGEKQGEVRMGAVKGSNVNVRMQPVDGMVIAKLSTGHSVEAVETMTASDKKEWCYIKFVYGGVAQEGYIRSDFIHLQDSANLTEAAQEGQRFPMSGCIKGINVRIRKSAVDGTVICQKSNGFEVSVTGEMTGSDKKVWNQVTFTYKGKQQTGYVRSDFVTQADALAAATDQDFEAELEKQGFPESYRVRLRALHEKHPKWTFQAVSTGLKWDNVVAAESRVGKNFVPKNSIASFKSLEKTAYNAKKDKWYTFDGGSWVAASGEVVAYYLDPRNFLTESDIFQFETLEYKEYQNVAGLTAMLSSTFMRGTYTEPDKTTASYAETFVRIGKQVLVNPYHLAARCCQEQGSGKGDSISGKAAGYENLFNYFHVGAYSANGNSPVRQGLIYASKTDQKYLRPWNTRYKSMLGGAMYLKEKFIAKKQNTLYFQKFNVVNSVNGIYSHQYMTNLSAAVTEAEWMKKAYGDKDQVLEFIVPIYSDMPGEPCPTPSSDLNPNNYLASITVGSQKLTPAFDGSVTEYAVKVGADQSTVTISASPVAKTSTVSGTGKAELKKGVNTVSIVCRSASGSERTYTLNITRK